MTVVARATLAAALLTSAVGPSVAAAAPATLGDRQDGATVRVTPGQTVVVRLTSNLSTGFAWRPLGHPVGLALVSQRYDPPPPRRQAVLLVGRPGVQTFRFRIAAPPGRALPLRFAYRRWWSKVGFGRVWTAKLIIAASR